MNFVRNTRVRARTHHEVSCGARRKYDGASCEAKALPNGRCRLHGGLSTGPKSIEGRMRIAAFMRARWARKRAKKQANEINGRDEVSQQISIAGASDAEA